jgi:hypothetical protein
MSTAPTQIDALMPDTAANVLLGTSDPYETAGSKSLAVVH